MWRYIEVIETYHYYCTLRGAQQGLLLYQKVKNFTKNCPKLENGNNYHLKPKSENRNRSQLTKNALVCSCQNLYNLIFLCLNLFYFLKFYMHISLVTCRTHGSLKFLLFPAFYECNGSPILQPPNYLILQPNSFSFAFISTKTSLYINS